MIKLITGYNRDQHYTIIDDEAHKAYYLFLNPEQRGVFNNGLALIGKNIHTIQPDFQATMGWNQTHELGNDDWEDIRSKGVDKKLNAVLEKAKQIAYLVEKNPQYMNMPLSEIKIDQLGFNKEIKSLADKFKV